MDPKTRRRVLRRRETRVEIHGLSAGSGLCAAMALTGRDRGGPTIAFQFLGLPEVDDRLTTASSMAFIDTRFGTSDGLA